jgi:creatinine amidohydrolase
MQLHLQTWPEVEAYLQKSRGIIMPIGSTEQHGPVGLIGTDAICAEIVARGVGEMAGALVGPTIGVGMAQHHMAFAGSVTLRPSTLIAVLRDMVELAVHGFERFYFINGHGGNIATISAAFSEIYAGRSMAPAGGVAPIKCRLRNWWQAEGVMPLAKELYGDSEGSHATPSEVAVTRDPQRGRGDPVRPPGGDQRGASRSADCTARRLHRRCRLPPQLPGWPHRLQLGLGDTRGRQTSLRYRRRRARQGLREMARCLNCDICSKPSRRESWEH